MAVLQCDANRMRCETLYRVGRITHPKTAERRIWTEKRRIGGVLRRILIQKRRIGVEERRISVVVGVRPRAPTKGGRGRLGRPPRTVFRGWCRAGLCLTQASLFFALRAPSLYVRLCQVILGSDFEAVRLFSRIADGALLDCSYLSEGSRRFGYIFLKIGSRRSAITTPPTIAIRIDSNQESSSKPKRRDAIINTRAYTTPLINPCLEAGRILTSLSFLPQLSKRTANCRRDSRTSTDASRAMTIAGTTTVLTY